MVVLSRIAGGAVAAGFVATAAIAGTANVDAAQCPAPKLRCYAQEIADVTQGLDGGYGVLDVEAYQAPDYLSGGHSNQTIWLADVGGDNWCEVGWTKGGFTDTNGQYSGGYSNYYAWKSGGNYHQFTTPYDVGSPGTQHAYQIWRDPSLGLG